MPKHIRHLRAIRRRAWILVVIGIAGQTTAATLDPAHDSAMQTGAALAAPLQETAR